MEVADILKEIASSGLAVFISVFFIMKLLPQLLQTKEELSKIVNMLGLMQQEQVRLWEVYNSLPKRHSNGSNGLEKKEK